MDNCLLIKPRSLVVFIDETGSEDYGDPNFPVFGYGGCAIIGADYDKILAKPWKRLKRARFGGANKPFHTVAFQKSKLTLAQINSINRFVKKPFFRFATISRIDTARPKSIDPHKAVAQATIIKVRNIVSRNDAASVDLVFEDTERNREAIRQDFNPNYLDNLRIENSLGAPVEFNGYFLSKESCTPGLEVADLVVHTAGRQERLKLKPNPHRKFQPDFIEVFQGINPEYVDFISADSVTMNSDN